MADLDKLKSEMEAIASKEVNVYASVFKKELDELDRSFK